MNEQTEVRDAERVKKPKRPKFIGGHVGIRLDAAGKGWVGHTFLGATAEDVPISCDIVFRLPADEEKGEEPIIPAVTKDSCAFGDLLQGCWFIMADTLCYKKTDCGAVNARAGTMWYVQARDLVTPVEVEVRKPGEKPRPPMPEDLRETLPRMFKYLQYHGGKCNITSRECLQCVVRRALAELGMEVPG